MTTRTFAAVLLAAWLLLGHATQARAHSLSLSHVDIRAQSGASTIEVEIDIPLRDLALAMPLDVDRNDAITWGELVAARPALEDQVRRSVILQSPAGACALRPNALAVRDREGITHATLQLSSPCTTGTGLSVTYGLLADVLPDHAALVTLGMGDSVSAKVARKTGGYRVDFPPHAARDGSGNLLVFLREGVHHILIGYDHLAFLLSLLLPAALVRMQGQWTPATSLARPLGHSAAIVSAFTVAHSITLSLAALGWVRPAPQVIEAAIALSVALAALNNVWPVVTRRLWLAAFGFGLIHGFGFAGALSELGLGRTPGVTALLGFNLGVELGQLAVVGLVLPVLFWIRKREAYARLVMPVLSLGIVAIGLFWLAERLSG